MKIGNHEHLTNLAKELFKEERSLKKLDGWFRIKEFRRETDEQFADLPAVEKAGQQLKVELDRSGEIITVNVTLGEETK